MDCRIKEILAEVEKNLSKPFLLPVMAASVNLSVSRFQHLFKKEVQISFVKYINNRRLEKARYLLETTHLKINEIRLKVGVKNEAHFLNDFKRKFGASPVNYRKNYLEKYENKFQNSANG